MSLSWNESHEALNVLRARRSWKKGWPFFNEEGRRRGIYRKRRLPPPSLIALDVAVPPVIYTYVYIKYVRKTNRGLFAPTP